MVQRFPDAMAPWKDAPAAREGSDEGEELHLKDYLRIVARRRWLALGVFVMAFALAGARSLRQTPIYEASATLRIERGGARILSGVEDIQTQTTDRQRFYDTQYKLLRTRSLAEATLESLGLVEQFVEAAGKARPSWSEKALAWSREALGAKKPPASIAEAPPEERGRQAAADWMASNLSVRPEPNSELVTLIFASPNPQLCAQVANELARQFIQANVADRSKAYRSASEALQSELATASQALEAIEREMREYAGGRDQLALESRRAIADQRLAGLAESLAEAERDVLSKKATMDQALEDVENSSLSRADGAVAEARTRLAEALAERDRLAAEYGPKYPPLQQAKDQVESLRTRLAESRESVKRSAVAAYNLALDNYNTLKKTYDDQRQFVTELEDALVQYRMMARDAESERENYQRLLDRVKEVAIQQGVATSNVRVVEEAVPPLAPSRPRVGRSLALGGLAGLMLAVAAAFFADYMDRSVKTPEDLERGAGLSALATIPNLGGPTIRTPDGTKIPNALVSALLPGDPRAESFRYLRASLAYSTPGGAPKVLMVTSARPAEGKTTIAINTAASFAKRGARTIVIDGDLKRPACHNVFGTDRRLGLTAVLAGQLKLDEAIFPTEVDWLDFMPAGPIAPNPADLLESPAMREAMAELRERYEHVVIDSAPLAGMADSYILASLVDGVALVVEAGRTPRDLVRQVVRRLRAMGARPLGAVVNARRVRRRESLGLEYGHSYGYGYGYNYRYGGQTPELEVNVAPAPPPALAKASSNPPSGQGSA